MINIDKKIDDKKIKSNLLVQIHDELLFETKDTELNSELKIIKKEMEEAIYNEMDFSVPLIVDVNSAKNWNEAH